MKNDLYIVIFVSFFSLVSATESPKGCPSLPINTIDIPSSAKQGQAKKTRTVREYSPTFLNGENLYYDGKKLSPGTTPCTTPVTSPSVSPQVSTTNLIPGRK